MEIKTTLGLQIDASTVRKRLTQKYVKAKLPKKCPFLSPNNIQTKKILLGNTWAGHLQNGEIFFGQMRPKLTCLGQMH